MLMTKPSPVGIKLMGRKVTKIKSGMQLASRRDTLFLNKVSPVIEKTRHRAMTDDQSSNCSMNSSIKLKKGAYDLDSSAQIKLNKMRQSTYLHTDELRIYDFLAARGIHPVNLSDYFRDKI